MQSWRVWVILADGWFLELVEGRVWGWLGRDFFGGMQELAVWIWG